jgi:hypothetical protein
MLEARCHAKRSYFAGAEILIARFRGLLAELCPLNFQQLLDARGIDWLKCIWELSKGLRMMRLIKHGSLGLPKYGSGEPICWYHAPC